MLLGCTLLFLCSVTWLCVVILDFKCFIPGFVTGLHALSMSYATGLYVLSASCVDSLFALAMNCVTGICI